MFFLVYCLLDDFGCGLGWRRSLNQTLRRETILSTAYYIWQDGDATDHYSRAALCNRRYNTNFQPRGHPHTEGKKVNDEIVETTDYLLYGKKDHSDEEGKQHAPIRLR